MSSIAVEKDIPICGKRLRSSRSNYHSALQQLDVGDSFVIAEENARKIEAAIRSKAARSDIAITTRVVNNDGHIRVWRVELQG